MASSSVLNGQAALLAATDHRPWPLPAGQWVLQMRWTDLLFAHWPVAADEIAALVPSGFAVDTFDGWAWVGVVPFRMESVRLHGFPKIPGTHLFAEANVRTYVTDRKSGQRGVYFFSLDASNPLAVIGARSLYHLPYYFARMRVRQENDWLRYSSRRLFSSRPAELRVRYRGLGRQHVAEPSRSGTIEHFLTERYVLFTNTKKRLIRADIHHRPWPLEPALADFETLSVAAAQSVRLPATKPLLHFARSLDVFAWAPRTIG